MNLEMLGEQVAGLQVVETRRMKSTKQNKPGLVKVAFSSREDKVVILKEKKKLANTGFKDVMIWGSRSLPERIASQNFRFLLKNAVPGSDKFVVSANGRILEKRENRGNQEGEPSGGGTA